MSNARDKDMKYEVIDGVVYNMSPNGHYKHGMINSNIHSFINHKLNRSLCAAFVENLDLYDSEEDARKIKNFAVPDVMVMCDLKSNTYKGRYYGAPRFIVETLSDSTEDRDRSIKMDLYAKKGVEEYWLVDYRIYNVEVYYLREDRFVLQKIYKLRFDEDTKTYNYNEGITLRNFEEITINLGDIFQGVFVPVEE